MLCCHVLKLQQSCLEGQAGGGYPGGTRTESKMTKIYPAVLYHPSKGTCIACKCGAGALVSVQSASMQSGKPGMALQATCQPITIWHAWPGSIGPWAAWWCHVHGRHVCRPMVHAARLGWAIVMASLMLSCGTGHGMECTSSAACMLLSAPPTHLQGCWSAAQDDLQLHRSLPISHGLSAQRMPGMGQGHGSTSSPARHPHVSSGT